MASSIDRFQKFTEQIQEFQREIDKAKGVLDHLLKQLKEEFACDSLETATKLLKKKEKTAKAVESELEEALDEFEERWGETLESST